MVAPDMVALTFPAPPGTVSAGDPNQGTLSPGEFAIQRTIPNSCLGANWSTNLVMQQAEQNTPSVAQNVQQQLWPDFGAYNDNYDGLSASYGDDIVSNLLSNIGQLIWKTIFEMPIQVGITLSLFLCLWFAPQVVLAKL